GSLSTCCAGRGEAACSRVVWGRRVPPPGPPTRPAAPPPRLLGPPAAAPATPETGLSLEDVERRHIVQVLAESSTLEEAAARLGINVTTLWRKRRRYGIE